VRELFEKQDGEEEERKREEAEEKQVKDK